MRDQNLKKIKVNNHFKTAVREWEMHCISHGIDLKKNSEKNYLLHLKEFLEWILIHFRKKWKINMHMKFLKEKEK